MQLRAACYTRVSSAEQVDNFSLSTQEKKCREYCAQNSWPVAAVFREEGESAKTANRTELQRLLAFCADKKNQIGYVVVYDVSRFSRQSADYHALKALLARSNIVLRSATQAMDETPQGQFMGDIYAAFASFDNRQRATRTTEGMKAAISAGKWTHRAPLGFINTPTGLAHDPVRAHLIRKAFERIASGAYSQREVLNEITALGLCCLSGRPVSLQGFHKMLRKPIYAGRIVVRNLGENLQADFEPIIPPQLFDEVQIVLHGKRKNLGAKQRLHPDFPLRVFVRCGYCSHPLTGSWSTGRAGKRYAHYCCRNGKCRRVNTRKEELESAFVSTLEMFQPTATLMRLFDAVVLDVLKERQSTNLTRAIAAKQRLEEVEQKIEELETAFLFEKRIDRQTYESQLSKMRERRLLVQIEQGEAACEGFQVEGVLEFAKHALMNAAELWQKSTPELRQKFQRLIFPKGVFFKDGVFGTAETSPVFNVIRTSASDNVSMASPRGFEPRFSP